MSFMKLLSTTQEQFSKFISEDRADKFAKTFVSKANMQKQWEHCIGYWEEEELLGAIITTVSKRKPHVANLQLLHTFAKHRRKGVARILTQDALERAISNDSEYFRVSAEPGAVDFYKSMGFRFFCKQKSGCQLSMFKINGSSYTSGLYDREDVIIDKALSKKGKGGCWEYL